MVTPVLAATRTRLLASNTVVSLNGQNLLAQSDGSPAISIGVDPSSGTPWVMEAGKCSIALDLREREWLAGNTSARFPTVSISVWCTGDEWRGDGKEKVRQVAMALALELDDPSNSKPKFWTDDIFVDRCRWSGICAVAGVEGTPGMYRSEVTLELMIV